MNKKFLFLTKTSLSKKLKSKWFIIINVLLLFLIVGIINIDSIINFFGGDFTEKLEIVIKDNTHEASPIFKNILEENKKEYKEEFNISIKETKTEEKKLKKDIKKEIVVVLDKNEQDQLKAKIISKKKIDSIKYQIIVSSLTATKYNYGLIKSNINPEELAQISQEIKIDRIITDENENTTGDNMEMIMNTVFPTVILPFFMLIIILVQMIGAEIYEEKSSRSMEIIISNVSPKTHFLSKIASANIFAISQGLLLILYTIIGFATKSLFGNNETLSIISKTVSDIWKDLVAAGFTEQLIYIIPLTLVLLVLSFFSYSLISGILASLTVNMEDYQQIQTPIMIVLLISYYLAILAGAFEGSIFIKVLSYVPFISCLLSPALLLINQIGVIDVLISIILLIIFNYFMFKQGIKIYKVGILNYSNDKVWNKFKKALKSRNDK